jgi:hypothetical protein
MGVSDVGDPAGIEPVAMGSGDSPMDAPGAIAPTFAGVEALGSGFTNSGTALVSEL